MKEPTANELIRSFTRQIDQLERLTDQALVQRKKNNLTIMSVDALFTSAFLSMHLRFELFLENLFYSCITGNSQISDCRPHLIFANRTQAENIFFGGVPFPVWMPYKTGVEPIANRAFADGGPFSRLDKQPDEQLFLKQLSDIRNAIAHQSSSALKKVEHLTSQMRPRRRTPAGYLQNSAQGQTQYSIYASSLMVIASALAKPDRASAKQILAPESEYQNNEQATAGKYQCVRCGHYKVLRGKTRIKLGSCSRCIKLKNKPKSWRRVY